MEAFDAPHAHYLYLQGFPCPPFRLRRYSPEEGRRGQGSGERPKSEVLKVSAKSKPSSVAGAIAGVIRQSGRAEVQAIGAGAINQAIKAIAIARGYLAANGFDIVCVPSFIEVKINDEERTAILLIVEKRPQ